MKSNKISILLCEDDASFGMLLCEYLRERGYEVELAQNGEQGWQFFNAKKYDICIFDIMMPHKTGMELTKDIRAVGSEIPIIFLTAKNQPEDILEGYRAGADDYVCKPCQMEIMIYKIESIMRRIRNKEEKPKTEFHLGKFFFDATRQSLVGEGENIHLSSKEAELLQMLCNKPNALVERSFILKNIWQNDSYFSTRSLSVYINHLRNHLAGEPNVKIMSVHGKGYKIIVPEYAQHLTERNA